MLAIEADDPVRMPSGEILNFVALALLTILLVTVPLAARAQLIDQFFQPGVPGFGEERGVPVLSRAQPEYAEPSIHLGGFTIRANLDQSVTYNSNVEGVAGGPGSWIVSTAPFVEADAIGSHAQLSTALSLDDSRYLDTPAQSRTDWTASLGGSYDFGHSTLTLGYAHLNEHEVATTLGTLPSTTAIPYQVDDVRAAWSFDLGRLTLTPNLEYAISHYGAGTVLGRTVDQSFSDRNDLTAGVTARYRIDASRGLLMVVQGIDSEYPRSTPGQLSSSSRSVIVLGGVDYQSNGVFLYRVLAGFERRSFAASQFPTTTTPAVEARVIWLPSGLTTVTATISRRVEDATTANTGSYTYTNVALVLDHELRRNILLQARTNYQLADYTAGGTQNSFGAGGGVTWLLNPRMRLTADYDYTRQGAVSGAVATISSGAASTVSSKYDLSLFTVKLHIAL